MKTRNCRVCNVVLDSENWYASCRKKRDRICKECKKERSSLWAKANPERCKVNATRWRKANPDKVKTSSTKTSRKAGHQSFEENKECPMFLGVHIAERVLSLVFKDVKRMPMNHPGYDVICNRDKRIDIKSSCTRRDKRWGCVSWRFEIKQNTTADFFLCLAFDNREDLTPLHAWLLPGSKFNHLATAVISLTTIHKWAIYRLDISKINDCCDKMRL